LLDDTREAPDVGANCRTLVATHGRTWNVLLLPSCTAAADHVHRSPQPIARSTPLPFISGFI